jgi:hypothetical protein
LRDEKLKKGQIRIIVIATGFPEQDGMTTPNAGSERSLFAMPVPEKEEVRGKIYNDVVRREEQASEPAPSAPEPLLTPSLIPMKEMLRREEPIVTAQPQRRDEPKTITPPVVEEEDAWGAIPNFLKRHKK